MDTWVQVCLSCGYCTKDLSKIDDGAAEVVHSDVYKEIRARVELPANARDFLCHALISESLGRLDQATWGTMCAAWLCDDDKALDLADQFRQKAADLARRADLDGQALGPDTGASQSICTDLLRRAGKFDEARECAQEGLDLELPEVIEHVLRFELLLIEARDRSCRTVAEAVETFKVEVKADPHARRGTQYERLRRGELFAKRPERKTRHTDLNTPLTDAEIVRLSSFLASGAAPISAMNFSMADGYLAALAAGPTLVLPDEMLRWVWDSDKGIEQPIFSVADDIQSLTNLVLRHYFAIINGLNSQAYRPRVNSLFAAKWFRGFFVGVTTEYPDWLPLMSSRIELFEAVLRYGTADEDQEFADAELEMAVASTKDTVHQIHLACKELRLKALGRRTALGELFGWNRIRAPNKVRRNDPCLCGSQMEFKLCHGKKSP